MMAMLGSQSMTFLLCQGMSYPPLEEEDGFTVREIAPTTYVPHPLIEDVMDGATSSNEHID